MKMVGTASRRWKFSSTEQGKLPKATNKKKLNQVRKFFVNASGNYIKKYTTIKHL